MSRRQQAQNTTMALRAVGAVLFTAMAVGLIVSSVLWSNEISALKKANNFTVTEYINILADIADARVISFQNMYLSVDNNIQARTTVTEYPNYYTIDYVVAGSFRYNTSGSQTQVVVSGMLPNAFPFPSVGSLGVAAMASLCFVQGGGTSLMAGWFTENAVSGLITDVTIALPFGYVDPPAPSADGLVIILPQPITWVVYK